MLTQKRLKELLHYDPETGVFTWLYGCYRGKVAGGLDQEGYRTIRISKKEYRAHRLAFLYVEGYLPEYQVDHKNGNRDDNRWSNLRHVTQACNNQNRVVQVNNRSGFPGVHYQELGKGWVARLKVGYVRYYHGFYRSPLEAALARLTAEVQCPMWTCNHRSEIVRAIKKVWPEFDHWAALYGRDSLI